MAPTGRQYSRLNIAKKSSKHLKYKKYLSETAILQTIQKKQEIIGVNFKYLIRRLMACQKKKNNKINKSSYLISFLNIMASCQYQQICSITCIPANIQGCMPSIQNMISNHFINNYKQQDKQQKYYSNNNQSCLSFTQPLLSQILLAQPELPVYFVCLFDRITHIINCNNLSKKQNQNIIKGTWNILLKYWKDKDYILFNDVSQKIQWGLLQLLNFKFNAGKKQRFQAEQTLRKILQQTNNKQNIIMKKIKQKNYSILNINEQKISFNQLSQKQQKQQKNYFCTLQYLD